MDLALNNLQRLICHKTKPYFFDNFFVDFILCLNFHCNIFSFQFLLQLFLQLVHAICDGLDYVKVR